jgi:hypothetical protein
MVTYAISYAEQGAVVFTVDAIDVFRIEPLVPQVQVNRPMRAAVQVRDQAGAGVLQQEARPALVSLLELESPRLPGSELSRPRDVEPRRTQASAARDGAACC